MEHPIGSTYLIHPIAGDKYSDKARPYARKGETEDNSVDMEEIYRKADKE
jgi:hypothetical protein